MEKGFKEVVFNGGLVGYFVEGIKIVLMDGVLYVVDLFELVFKFVVFVVF